ncbi:hypothetical protein ACIQWZ_19005 [Streptomyces sp. NPDC098077]|uniref:hypothetical protein n=1 Tax=Streptomyces sp. NPDC098077 TaxID=3366093 RepID=UPI00382C0CA2
MGGTTGRRRGLGRNSRMLEVRGDEKLRFLMHRWTGLLPRPLVHLDAVDRVGTGVRV